MGIVLDIIMGIVLGIVLYNILGIVLGIVVRTAFKCRQTFGISGTRIPTNYALEISVKSGGNYSCCAKYPKLSPL